MDNNTETDNYIPLYLQGKYNNENNKIENKPESEQKCFAYQTEWLQTRNPEVWEKWVALVFNYTRSLILKKLSNKKFLEPDEVDAATADATFSFMAQYLKPTKDGKQFEVGASFAGMINFKILEALYRDRDNDRTISLNQLKSDDDKRELGDTIKELQYTDNFSEYLRYNMNDLVEDIYHEIDCMFGSAYDRCTAKIYTNIVLMNPRSAASKTKFLVRWGSGILREQLDDLMSVMRDCAVHAA